MAQIKIRYPKHFKGLKDYEIEYLIKHKKKYRSFRDFIDMLNPSNNLEA